MNGREYSSWFDQTYKDTYSTIKRVGQVLLVHLCPALLDDIDELLETTYCDMSKKEKKLRSHPNIIGWLVVAFRYVVYHRIRAWYKEQRALRQLQAEIAGERAVDPFQEAFLFEETETLMRIALPLEIRTPVCEQIQRYPRKGLGRPHRKEGPYNAGRFVALAKHL